MPKSRRTGVCERTLYYIPIIHTAADMGTLGAQVQGAKLSALGRQGLARNAAVVEKLWEEIESALAGLPFAAGSVRVYQDGLAVCGHEQKIVAELAGAGNRNHALLLKLQAQGATLMGTESPELLVEEYQLAVAAFAPRATAGAAIRRKELHDTLLDKRDRFIADRIDGTLGVGESGVLFVGMLHKVAMHLNPGIKVVYPLGPPRVMQGRGA